ncbi:hypothetical protein [Desulfurispira natronophila]|uniref:Tetratricopeptide (TPR) repeat protein n=1 Tax=Desulfurispira natronophila TaxID=682562 RepID=A0A7W8DHB6_9BACT|nr:hypothetical protein [Desulfurispira natronophila]MBB5022113.1 tetratricopeptide (TPR) repeat protein [Desulfurispira natronophila]
MKILRRYFTVIVFFGLLIGALFYYLTHYSWELYRQGVAAYERGDYRQAHALFEESLEEYRYNQNSILMRRNARFALMTEEIAEKVEQYLERADEALAQRDFVRVERTLQMALLAFDDVRSRELGDLQRINELEERVRQRWSEARLEAQRHYMRQAREAVDAGDFLLAYSYTQRIDPPTREVRLFQSKLAMEIARRDIEYFLKHDASSIAPHQVRLAIYWLNQVHRDSPYSEEAQQLRKKLELALEGGTP